MINGFELLPLSNTGSDSLTMMMVSSGLMVLGITDGYLIMPGHLGTGEPLQRSVLWVPSTMW